ncbi:MAG: pyridoxamine 5'-phosphate oxidase family protein [Methanotrichaceae archaeon]|nr:pyridoxamine 5'-phosphate oxidase family protein [Methanotrichaceae archaeon]
MEKSEYDMLIDEEFMCRIAFNGELRPYIAPFLYVFDGKFLYFLSTKYGKKVQHFMKNPLVTVEIERYSSDLSSFAFVSIPGRLVEVEDQKTKRAAREMFVQLIKSKGLSLNVLSALGHSPDKPIESLLVGEQNSVWKLVGVDTKQISGLKSSGRF